jgi:hypothetical protein
VAAPPMLLKSGVQPGWVHPDERLLTPQSRGRAFVAINREGQLKFFAERFSQLDAVELANIVRAIYGRPHDKGRPRKP